MSSPPLASLDELNEWLPSPASNETRAERMLTAASSAVRAYKGLTYLDEEGELLEDIPDDVKTVTLLVAERLLSGPPDGNTQNSVGSFSEQWTRSGIYLTSAEKAMLDGPANSLTSVKVTAPNFHTDDLLQGTEVVEGDGWPWDDN